MVHHIEIFLREIRRWFSRSEWIIRVLGLPKSINDAGNCGLILVQVDGLSRAHLENALNKNKMPRLKKMLEADDYRLHSLYSGIPSSTPSVQGELFYGVKSVVPAFSYFDKKNNKIQTMYEPACALAIEKQLADNRSPLLKDGSGYCNIYTGGASESHFSASSFGWDGVLRAANPFVLVVFLITNSISLLRVLLLLVIETFIAFTDCIAGLIAGRDLFREFAFIPARVLICILLRELSTIGAKIDVVRGLPVIHLNLLGYDEQAHRRGPSSKFAYWSLKGVDEAINRIWQTASRARFRHYDIWVYSDHGQEDTIPYHRLHGISVKHAINKVFMNINLKNCNSKPSHGIQTQRARYIGGRYIQKLFKTYENEVQETDDVDPVITAMGPLGLIYSQNHLSEHEKEDIASRLVVDAHIPLVLYVDRAAKVNAITASGNFQLPEDRQKLFGSDHPFLDETTEDLINVCRHKYAGDFIFIGWRSGTEYVTFQTENGSHAGPGPNETHAFAILPRDTDLPETRVHYLRPYQLRDAALHHLGRDSTTQKKAIIKTNQNEYSIRVMTYNVHSCLGMDGKISPQRIARVIARYEPDIIALQELDVNKTRTKAMDQASYLAHTLEMEYHFHPAIHIEEEKYGDAILTHFPMELVKAEILPCLNVKPAIEPRGALWVRIKVNGHILQMINTHLDMRKYPREQQARALLGEQWLNHPEFTGARIFCGDLNALPSSKLYKSITQSMIDSQLSLKPIKPQATFFTRFPAARIDYIFVDRNFRVLRTLVPNTHLTRIASDHFPVISDIVIGPVKS